MTVSVSGDKTELQGWVDGWMDGHRNNDDVLG